MECFDVSTIEVNSIVKFINSDKTLFDGQVKIIANNCLGIKINVNQNKVRQLNKDEVIEIIIIQKKELIKCRSIVLGNKINDLEQFVIINEPKPIFITERRKFERLPIVMDIEYSPLSLEKDYDSLSNVNPKYFRLFKKAYTVDISAGGVNTVILKDENIGKFALVSLVLKNEKITSLCSKVRVDVIKDSKYNNIALEFFDIKEEHRQLILDFVSYKLKENSCK